MDVTQQKLPSNETDFVIEDSVLIEYQGSDSNVVIPAGVTSIGTCAFAKHRSLISVTIPDSVTSIGYKAFCECVSLASVNIPSSITEISVGAFAGCPSLALSINENNGAYCVVDNVLFSKDKSHLHTYISSNSTKEYIVPDTVTSIDDWAFYGYVPLASITLPNTITSIGDFAFGMCLDLASITIPNSVASIDYCAFFECLSLTDISIPDSVSLIGEDVFDGCAGLERITLPSCFKDRNNLGIPEGCKITWS